MPLPLALVGHDGGRILVLPQEEYMCNFESTGMYYFLRYHTSPQSALHSRAYVERSKRVPTASSKGGDLPSCYVLAGVNFSPSRSF